MTQNEIFVKVSERVEEINSKGSERSEKKKIDKCLERNEVENTFNTVKVCGT